VRHVASKVSIGTEDMLGGAVMEDVVPALLMRMRGEPRMETVWACRALT
jgi:hypothetical protein